MKNCVYRFIDKNACVIYVGKAKELKQRLYCHNHLPKECYDEVSHIEYLSFETEDDIDFAERYFISKMKPKYNIVHISKNITIEIEELNKMEWSVYQEGYTNELKRLNKLKENGRLDFNMRYNWCDLADYLILEDIFLRGYDDKSLYRNKFNDMFEELYQIMKPKLMDEVLALLNKQFPTLGFNDLNRDNIFISGDILYIEELEGVQENKSIEVTIYGEEVDFSLRLHIENIN